MTALRAHDYTIIRQLVGGHRPEMRLLKNQKFKIKQSFRPLTTIYGARRDEIN